MLVMLKLSDGTEQTMDVVGLRISVGDRPLDLSPWQSSSRLLLKLPGDDDTWQQFVVHHSAANVMMLEVVSHPRSPDGSTPANC